MINEEHEINIVNSEVKIFLAEYFQNEIQSCTSSDRATESTFVFRSSINLQNVVQKLCLFKMKTLAEKLRQDFLSVNFNLNDIFSDGNDLND